MPLTGLVHGDHAVVRHVIIVADDRLRRVRLIFDEDLRAVVQLLPLHAPVLEPDLDLAFGEVQLAGDLPALLSRDVRIADELVLEHHRLVARVRLSLLPLTRLIW